MHIFARQFMKRSPLFIILVIVFVDLIGFWTDHSAAANLRGETECQRIRPRRIARHVSFDAADLQPHLWKVVGSCGTTQGIADQHCWLGS